MSRTVAPSPALALRGWRARAWAWVLFLALFKGLIPHAAVAGVLMNGNPALLWCAPGTQTAQQETSADEHLSAAAHSCVCASAADGAPPISGSTAGVALAAQSAEIASLTTALIPQKLLPPPARGPPAL